jgi:eukaryotic-like serine/threonine-protein kinase
MQTGAKLSRYEIRKKIGSGGMGEVYLAHDEQLDRLVALKVLLPEFFSNQERIQRFKLEARAASALNHPNIITIYEIGEETEKLFIATEYVDGVTVREKIAAGKLTLLDAIKIAEQVADALAVAHEAHIVHRDIKPENIMIRRRDGYVKILDFGLAKPTFRHPAGAEDKTLKLVQTQAGMVIGSVRYMSPEQARGKEIDERSDIWSLGVVLYEMLSGRNPFDGETVSDSLAALIHIEPPDLENIPEDLNKIVKKALRKNAAERYQSIKDFAEDLKELRSQIEHNSVELKAYQAAALSSTSTINRQDTSEGKTLIHQTFSLEKPTVELENKTQLVTGERRRKFSFLPVIILGLAGILALGAWYFQPFSKTKPESRFESIQISRITENGRAGFPAISPDGKYVAFVNNEGGLRSLTVRQVATGSSVQVVPPTNLNFFPPTFSNDGNYIYYTLVDKAVGTLYQVPSLGGSPKKLILDVDSKVNFSPDGKRLAFKRHDPDKNTDTIIVANSDGTDAQPLINTAETSQKVFTEISWFPNGEKLLVGSVERIFNDGTESVNLITVSLKDKRIEKFGDKTWINANSFGWLKDGSGVYMLAKKSQQEQSQIWFLSFPEGEARQITQDSSGYVLMSYAADNNTIAALKSDIISSLWALDLQSKQQTQITPESRDMIGANGVKQLPDGKLLVSKTEGIDNNFWTIDESGKNETEFRKESGYDIQPVIAPDGRYIVFCSNQSGTFRLWRMDADGKNAVQLTDSSEGFDVRPSISPDNKTIIFERRFEDRFRSRLMKISIDGGGQPQEIFPESQTSNAFPSVSRDGKLLAYTAQSFDTKNLIFHSALKIASIEGENIKPLEKEINQNIGVGYQWTNDNKGLIYLNKDGIPNLFQAPLDKRVPKQLTNFNSGVILNFDSSRDGKRLFIVRGIVNADLILIKDDGGKSS